MKKFIIIATALLMSFQTLQAAEVKSAQVNGDILTLEVAYGGGCKEHKFGLELVGGCMESYPVQCTAKLVDSALDFCEAYIQETVEISLSEQGISGEYFEGAFLTILGTHQSKTYVQLD